MVVVVVVVVVVSIHSETWYCRLVASEPGMLFFSSTEKDTVWLERGRRTSTAFDCGPGEGVMTGDTAEGRVVAW